MGGGGGQGGGGGWLSSLLMPIPYHSGAKPGPTAPIQPAQPRPPTPLVGAAGPSQNPLTEYIMALTSSRMM